MKKLLPFLLVFLFGCAGKEIPPQTTPFDKFSWLQGKWERLMTGPQKSAFEVWSPIENSKFEGIGYTMTGNDTTFTEFLSFVLKEGDLYYVADVSHNPKPTSFKITSISDNGFVCENPEHDFPQKIEYILNETNLLVEISGQGKTIPFNFKKISSKSNH